MEPVVAGQLWCLGVEELERSDPRARPEPSSDATRDAA